MTEVLTAPAALPQPHAGRQAGRLRHRGLTILALGWLLLIIGGAVLAPVVAPYGVNRQDLFHVLKGPTAAHWLGTDTLGRDVLTRLLYGARPTLIAVALAIAVYVVVGSLLGLVAGYLKGWADRSISVLTSIILATPHIVILFVILSIYRGNVYLAMFVFGILAAPVMVMVVRASALAVRQELFVDAARVAGLSPWRIIFSHVLPRSLGLIVVQGTVFGANAIVLESALSFLGFGEQPPSPSWGNMVAEAAGQISLNAWMLYPTGATIALTALALGVVGDSLRGRVTGGWTSSALTLRTRRQAVAQAVVSPGEDVLLAVSNLSVGYRVRERLDTAVTGVSFHLRRGETLGIVGESGSGKTTVAFGLLGVVGDNAEITSGSIVYDGVDLLGLSQKQLARYRGKRIAYVAQEPMVALDPNYRVEHLLAEVITRHERLPRAAVHARVLELLTMVELKDPRQTARRYAHELSGGMAQRVSIAIALAGRPELLVADEPTTALDVTVQAGILGLLRRLREQTGLSIILITHDWGVVADLCDRVLVMYRGEVVEDSTAREVYRSPRHPYTRALLASNPRNARGDADLPVITGAFTAPSLGSEPETAR